MTNPTNAAPVLNTAPKLLSWARQPNTIDVGKFGPPQEHKYLTNPSITLEDQVIAAAAHLSNTLQGIRSPQLHTSTLKSLGDLQDIFHIAANKTPDLSPMQAPRTPPRVTPKPTPENNGHNAHNEEITTQELRVPLHTQHILPTPIPITKPLRRSQ